MLGVVCRYSSVLAFPGSLNSTSRLSNMYLLRVGPTKIVPFIASSSSLVRYVHRGVGKGVAAIVRVRA